MLLWSSKWTWASNGFNYQNLSCQQCAKRCSALRMVARDEWQLLCRSTGCLLVHLKHSLMFQNDYRACSSTMFIDNEHFNFRTKPNKRFPRLFEKVLWGVDIRIFCLFSLSFSLIYWFVYWLELELAFAFAAVASLPLNRLEIRAISSFEFQKMEIHQQPQRLLLDSILLVQFIPLKIGFCDR